MKKNLIAISILTVITAWSFVIYMQVGKLATGVSKSICFSIYKDVNYASQIYDNTTAQVKIVVEKVNKHKREVVYEENLAAKELKQYPDSQTAQKEKTARNPSAGVWCHLRKKKGKPSWKKPEWKQAAKNGKNYIKREPASKGQFPRESEDFA